MNDVDRERLTDMLLYAREAVSILGSRTKAEIASDVRTLYALAYAVQVIGEAANHVSLPTRVEFAALPWRMMIGMRNRLVHGYDDSRSDIIVDTVRNDLPPLIKILEEAWVEDDTP